MFRRFAFIIALLLLAPGSATTASATVYVAAPPVIIAPDYIDTYCMPHPSSAAAQPFVSHDGYPFLLDSNGRRIYCVPASYAISQPILMAPAGLMVVPYTPAAVLAAPVVMTTLTPSTTYYITVP